MPLLDMTITALGHSGVLLDRNGSTLIIDPGIFSDLSGLQRARAVLITHEHADHVDLPRVVEALTTQPQLEVWAPAGVAKQLTSAGAPADRTHAVANGDAFTAAGFHVRAMGEMHAVIHPELPSAPNVAFLIDDLVLHPGDSFTAPPSDVQVDVLFLAISAPWLKLREAVDYLRSVAPRVVIPVHDAILSDPGKMLTDRMMGALTAPSEYRRLAAGESYTRPDRGM